MLNVKTLTSPNFEFLFSLKKVILQKNSVIESVEMTIFCLLQTKMLIIMVSTTLNHRKFLKLQIKAIKLFT